MGQPGQASPSAQAWSELLHAEVGYLLGQAGVPVLHIKGPTVALWLYAPGERSWGDVDILVAPSRMAQALAVLDAHGLREVFPGVNRSTSTDHAISVRRTDSLAGADEVDVHDRFPGIDTDPERAFSILWARRLPAQLAHIDVWFPDLASRAVLTVLNTARSSGSPQARRDLTRLLDSPVLLDWKEVLTVARAVEALPALRAGLELAEKGRRLIEATELQHVPVSVEWKLRLAHAPRTALRLDELARLPRSQRLPAVGRWLFPPPAILRMRDPWAARSRSALAIAYLRRLGDGVRALPSSIRALRRSRH
ncbi:MAG: nucleotidyltransferase family protein [Actinomycetota bacterium]|nr:nucleotidyltransferase family protein [Actinomycetota bacterium]